MEKFDTELETSIRVEQAQFGESTLEQEKSMKVPKRRNHPLEEEPDLESNEKNQH